MQNQERRNGGGGTGWGAGQGHKDAREEAELIADRAHAIWEQSGRPEGCAQEHWLRAEAEVRREREQARQLRGGLPASAAPFPHRS